MCTKQVHELLIQNDNAVNCIFCSKQIQDPGRPKRYFYLKEVLQILQMFIQEVEVHVRLYLPLQRKRFF